MTAELVDRKVKVPRKLTDFYEKQIFKIGNRKNVFFSLINLVEPTQANTVFFFAHQIYRRSLVLRKWFFFSKKYFFAVYGLLALNFWLK